MFTYEVTIKTQYHPAERVYVSAPNSSAAIRSIRRQARIEDWFDHRNDGRVRYRAARV